MITIVYVSAATRLVDAAELALLIRQSRTNNEKAGITGLLLHVDGNFMQAAEGPEAAVLELKRKLERDPRHRGIITIVQEPITVRAFPNWSMGLRETLDLPPDDRRAISQFLVETHNSASVDEARRSVAVRLLDGFRQSMT